MVQIERAQAADVPALVELLKTLFAIEQDFQFDANRQRRGLLRLLEEPPERATVLVAREGGAIAGMASAQLVISTAEGAPSAWIEDVVVREGWRGRGIGRGLMSKLTDWARSHGATRIQLLADRDNAVALDFYRRLGLQQTNLIALKRTQLDR